MQNLKGYSVAQFKIYPLQLFILVIGIIIGVMIGSLNDKNQNKQNTEPSVQPRIKLSQTPRQIQVPVKKQISPQSLLLSYSLSSCQSFQINGQRSKLFKGHIYKYLPFTFASSQQGQFQSFVSLKSTVTKIQNDGQWIKLYDSSIKVPKEGKCYFNLYVVKNQYFVKREGAQKNTAVSRTDITVGFFMLEEQSDSIQLSQKIKQISQKSQNQSNSIEGIAAYGFNGRIYNNGELRAEEKIIKKNKQFTVLINRDEGFVAFQLEGETVGFIVTPQDNFEMVPFVEMYAVGSSLIITN